MAVREPRRSPSPAARIIPLLGFPVSVMTLHLVFKKCELLVLIDTRKHCLRQFDTHRQM
ncbi:hypothetical protein ACFLUR_04105 [Chloroflexota bacterium]